PPRPLPGVDGREEVEHGVVEGLGLLQVDRVARFRDDDQPRGRDRALHEDRRLETRVVLVSGHDQRRHLELLEPRAEVEDRGPRLLHAAQGERVAPGRPFHELGVELTPAGRVLRHVRRRVAARVERDRAIAAREEASLKMPAPGVAGELVDEDERHARALILVEEIDGVDARRRHQSDQAKLALRISNVFVPAGSWAVTVSPTFFPISVRASGARIEIRPRGGSASSEPTIWYRYSLPLSSS